jgi:phospholipid/cholesterol/gamma-HCH transport system permease protein
MRGDDRIETARDGEALVVRLRGRWVVSEASALDAGLHALALPKTSSASIDLSGVETLDTAGAWLVLRLERLLRARGVKVGLANVARQFEPLIQQVAKRPPDQPMPPHHRPGLLYGLNFLGFLTFRAGRRAAELLGFFGLVTVTILRSWRHPSRVRMIPLVVHMERTGVSALPIVGLLSFLIGIVVAYQGADQLRRFGAEIFTVDLLGIFFVRELGVLLCSIIIAGRSGSAFTAEIGTMQVNEEIDAMVALGIDPVEVLVLPRVFALMLTLPLLTFYANFMGIVGGALAAYAVLDISLPAFVAELRNAISGWGFWLGILKAPFFAMCIAMVGCHDGLRVSRSAESVGRLTTLSVVQSIFLVIVIDAAFSILFARLHI